MSTRRHEGLRNDAINASLLRALTSSDRSLFEQLTRASVAPGLRANSELAMAFAEELAKLKHPNAMSLLQEMATFDAKARSLDEFLVIAAAHGFAACTQEKHVSRDAWVGLKELADDERGIVREAVAEAIGSIIVRTQDANVFLREADGWMDDFFPAAVALETLTHKHVLEQVHNPEAMIALLDQGVSMIENATRASERRPGRRRLLDVLPVAIATTVRAMRGGQEWLTNRAHMRNPDLRAAFEKAVTILGKKGAHTEDLAAVVGSLDASQKPRRDPLSDFGPSRRRSKKHRGRSR